MSSIFQVPELVVGLGLSEAASTAFEPKVEVPKQSAWLNNPQRVPDIGLIAQLVAGGKVTMDDGQNVAGRLGFSPAALEALVWLAQNRLDFAPLLRMWRLSAVNPDFDEAGLSALVDKTLAHERLDWDYRPYLRALKTAELPGIGDIAYGIVRGILPAPSWVPVPVPTEGTTVPRFPMVDIDPVALAAALGFSEDMLRLLTGRSGLSLAPGLAAQAYFRSIINENDYTVAIGEGDLRTEWAATLLEASRLILTAGEYAELQLRGFLTADERRALTARHGMSNDDSDLLYDVLGRAPAVHAITTGLARGGTYNGDTSNIPEVYLSSMQRSNNRPEYYSIDYANRYTYPSPFVIRTLAEAGELGDAAAVEQLLLEIGWKPELATKVSVKWVPVGTATDPDVKKAQTSLKTTARSSYIKGEIGQTDATTALTAAGTDPNALPALFAVWDAERALIRKQLSVAQIQKALKGGLINPATGVAWTAADALAAFAERGYDAQDAQTLVDEA